MDALEHAQGHQSGDPLAPHSDAVLHAQLGVLGLLLPLVLLPLFALIIQFKRIALELLAREAQDNAEARVDLAVAVAAPGSLPI